MVIFEINGKKVRPLAEKGISFKRAFIRPDDIISRSTPASSQFEITEAQAREVFDDLDGRAPYRLWDAWLYVEGVPVEKGSVIILGENPEHRTYTLAFAGGFFDFWKRIENKELGDASGLESYNHGLNFANFKNNLLNNASKPFTYAVAEYGKITDENGRLVIDYQIPQFFVRWFWQKIIADAGYSVDWQPSDAEVFTGVRAWDTKIDNAQIVINETSTEQKPCRFDYRQQTMNRYYAKIAVGNDDANHYIRNGNYYAPNNGAVNYTYAIRGELTTCADLKRILIYKVSDANVELLASVTPNYNGTWGCLQTFKKYQIDFEGTAQFSKNDELEIWAEFVEPDTPPNCEEHTEVVGNTIDWIYKYVWGCSEERDDTGEKCGGLMPTITWKTSSDDTVQVNLRSLLAGIKQTDFVKDVMLRNGIFITADNVNKRLKVWRLDDIINGGDLLRIENYKVTKVSYRPKKLYKENIFRYWYRDNDRQDFADAAVFVNNDTLTEKGELYKTLYRANYLGENYFCSNPFNMPFYCVRLQYISFWIPERDDTGQVKRWKKIGAKSNYATLITGPSAEWWLATRGGATDSYNGAFHLSRFENVDWATLLQNGYKSYIERVLNNYKAVTAVVPMTIDEFQALRPDTKVELIGINERYIIGSARWSANRVELELYKLS